MSNRSGLTIGVMRGGLLLGATLFGLGCVDVPDDLRTEMETSMVSEVGDLSAVPEDLAADIEEVQLRASTGESVACFETFGDCSWCFTHEHTEAGGTFGGEPETVPCGTRFEGERATIDYDLEGGSISGTWKGNSDSYTVELSAERSASLTISAKRWTRSREAHLEVESLTASVSDGTVDSWAALFSYQGFGGRSWDGDVAFDGENLSGTLVGTDTTCTIAGTRDAPEIACE